MTDFEFLTLALSSLALLISILALFQIKNLAGSREEFEKHIQDAVIYNNYTSNNFPDLIEDFKKEIEKFRRIKAERINDSFSFPQLRTRYRRGELNPILQIDPDLYRNLNYIHDNLIIDFQHYIEIQKQATQKTIERWTEHLKSYGHGHFSEQDLAEQVLWSALPEFLNGDETAIGKTFKIELANTLSKNPTFVNIYNEETPERLSEIACQQLMIVINQIKKINQQILVIQKEAIEPMEKIMGSPPMKII